MRNDELHDLESKLRRDLSFWITTVVLRYEGRLPYHLVIHSLDTVVEDVKKRILSREVERRCVHV